MTFVPKGIIPPIITPLTDEGEVKLSGIKTDGKSPDYQRSSRFVPTWNNPRILRIR